MRMPRRYPQWRIGIRGECEGARTGKRAGMSELFADEPRESGGAGLLVRRVVMCLLALLVALALLNVFGQEATISRAATEPP
jgi:hypothetical protein